MFIARNPVHLGAVRTRTINIAAPTGLKNAHSARPTLITT